MINQLLLLLPFFFVFSVIHAQDKKTKSEETTSSTIKKGTASFYGGKFNGRLMANGEKFDQNKLTAACNQLSLGTWVRVSNLRNNKSVIVKITDRMHPKNKRLIDVSKAAAKKLGFVSSGLTKVKVEILKGYELQHHK